LDYEVDIDDLMLLEDANDFKKYLYSLHEEIDIYDTTDLYEFFYKLGWQDHCKVCIEFKLYINE
jgi:hypothetical protein